MSKISFTYFDLGGVVMNDLVSSGNGWEAMKRDLGVSKELDKAFDERYNQVEIEVQNGRDIDSYLPEFTSVYGLQFPPGYSMITDFVKRFHANKTIWAAVQKAHERGRIGLLTNMYPRMLDGIRNAGLLPPVTWDVVIDSSVEKIQKPSPGIYQIAEERAHVPAPEILFVDDRSNNTDAARLRGWQTFLYNPKQTEASSKELLELLS